MKKLVILFILMCLIVITACSKGKQDMVNELEFKYPNIKNVEIKGALFDIKGEGNDTSVITGNIETSNKNYMLFHKQEGDKLVIWFERKWWAIFSFPGKHKLTIQVPFSTNIKIYNSSGKVHIKNIDAENVILKTSSGKIIAENIKADQRYHASSGGIILNKAFSSDEISLGASSGNIKIDGVEADIKVRTSSGKITINDVNGNIKASASSGFIIIKDYKGSLELSTSSGSIKGEEINITSDSSFKTSSGNISIDYANINEDFSFDLKASSGKLKAGTVDTRGELHAGNGSIKIIGRSTSGNQSYK